MILLYHLFTLPPILIALVFNQVSTVSSQEIQWPYNLPPNIKYYPEDEVFVKRNIELQQRLREEVPSGLRKMSGDPDEKFFFDYWHFREEDEEQLKCTRNISSIATFEAPIKRHLDTARPLPIIRRILGSSIFEKRDFQCPVGSAACMSINRPNSCCATGSTCQIVQDIGLGDVGCCPANQVCGGSVSICPAGGYTNCPQNPGGGCCLPGYGCLDVGCVATSTAVVTVVASTTSVQVTTSISTTSLQPTTVTQTTTTVVVPLPAPTTSTSTSTSTSVSISTSTSSSAPVSTSTAVSVISVPSTVTTITTATSTSTPSSATSTSSSSADVLVCSSGFRSCPASLGGGCCPTDRACGRDVCPEISSTGSFTAPARPTSNTVTATSTSTTSSFSSVPGAGCPTGFYACSAYYGGGCCQTGRDCAVSSCPTGASITVVSGNGVSVIAPTGNGISSVATLLTGSCAKGWTTCGSDVGGGCCPSGYACGSACTATATAGQGSEVGKIAPQSEAVQISPRESKSTLAFLGILVALVLFA